MQGVCRDVFCYGSWLPVISYIFFPAGSHSQYLQEAFIANTCQVFSINTTKDIFHTFHMRCPLGTTERLVILAPNQPM